MASVLHNYIGKMVEDKLQDIIEDKVDDVIKSKTRKKPVDKHKPIVLSSDE